MLWVIKEKLNDPDIRSALRAYLERNGSAVKDEMSHGMGAGYDVVEITSTNINGYEIKSDIDTLRRLKGQVVMYNLTFDYCTIVTTDRYIKKVVGILPEWWGIIRASPGVTIEVARDPKPSPEDIKSRKMYQAWLMWNGEYEDLCRRYDCLKGKGRSATAMRERLIGKIGEEAFKKELHKVLSERVMGSWQEKYSKKAIRERSKCT